MNDLAPIVQAKVGLRGLFKIEAVRPDGTRRLLAPWQDNLITDAGMDSIGSTGRLYISKCHVGSGNTAPAFSNTGLVAEVAVTGSLQSETISVTSVSPYYVSDIVRYRFGVGAAAGNLSELGMGPDTGSLFSRALIKDGLGSPTTITVLADEQLDVTYEFRRYQVETDWVGVVVISGVSYTVTVRPSLINTAPSAPINNFYANWTFSGSLNLNMGTNATGLGSITGSPTPGGGGAGYIYLQSYSAYTAGTYYRDSTFFSDLNDGNMPYGANWISTSGGVASWQIGFSPNIPKDGTKTLSLTFRFAWARHAP